MKRFFVGPILALSFSACGGNGSPTAPATTPILAPGIILRPTSTFRVTGIVTDDDGNPVAGANITVQPWVYATTTASVSAMTDESGSYSIDFDANRDAVGGVANVKAESSGHDPSYYYLVPASGSQTASKSVHLYRIRRITAGESTYLTVVPGDTSCGDNDQFMCRTVHVVAPSDGVMTIEALPTPSAASAGLEIAGRGSAYQCCSLIVSAPVSAGREVIANFGMWWTLTASQSFVLKTSLVRP